MMKSVFYNKFMTFEHFLRTLLKDGHIKENNNGSLKNYPRTTRWAPTLKTAFF